MNTNPEEFIKFLKLLPKTPILIPIIANSKLPDVPKGESWKDEKHYLTPEQTIKRLENGQNVGIVLHDWLVVVDLDQPTKYMLPIKTLTIQTRNASKHLFFLNGGDVENAVGKNILAKCGEVRAEWQYVLAAGSYVPKDDDAPQEADGTYRVIIEMPPTTLMKKDLPEDFVPTTINIPKDIITEKINKPTTIRNKYGWSLQDIRESDKKLDALLNNSNADFPSPSEADMSTLAKLLFWEFEENEAVQILKQFRTRPKLERSDYILNTLARITIKEKISDKIDPKKWNPKLGYAPTPEEENKLLKKFVAKNGTTTISVDMDKIIEYLDKIIIYKTSTDTEEIYVYKEGIYEHGEIMIKEELEKVIGFPLTSHCVEEVLNHLRRRSYTDRGEFNKYTDYIPCQNGLYNLNTDILEPFDENKIFTYKLNAEHTKNINCPKFKEFLNQILDQDDIPCIQEYLGYCLIPKMPYHKMLWLHGVGRNGKGTLIRSLTGLVGQNNCANIPIEQLTAEYRFSVARLYGKAVNVSSEPSTKGTLTTETLKKITGQDTIEAEVKNKQNCIKFVNFAKIIIQGNKFPRINDDTLSFWERVLFVPFPHVFSEKTQVPNLEERWLNDKNEMSGILNWMIEGYKRLEKQNGFSSTKTMDNLKLDFKKASDSVMAFVTEECIVDPNFSIPKKELWEAYKVYADDMGLTPDSDKSFNEKMKRLPRVTEKISKIDDKSVRIWSGIKLKITPKNKGGFSAIIPIEGVCGYCGEHRELCFKDKDGAFICRQCAVDV